MKNKKWLIPVVILFVIVALWISGIIPKQIAKISGTNYVNEHFPEMQMECIGVEYADVFGDYLITFKDKGGNTYSCVIGPYLFPCSLGQGLFEIQEYYVENFRLNSNTSNGHDTAPHPDAYIVIEVSETNLLVAEIGEDGKAIEEKQYSVPNVFHPANEIVVGDKVVINHNGRVKETFPMQFGQIYSMEHYDHETGLNTVVNID